MRKTLVTLIAAAFILGMAGQALAWSFKVRNTTSYRMYVYVQSALKSSGKWIEPGAMATWLTQGKCFVRVGGKIYLRPHQPKRMRTTSCRGIWNTGTIIPCCKHIRMRAERKATKSGNPKIVFDDDYGFTKE